MKLSFLVAVALSFVQLLEPSFASNREVAIKRNVYKTFGVTPSTPEAAAIRARVNGGQDIGAATRVVCKRLFPEPIQPVPVVIPVQVYPATVVVETHVASILEQAHPTPLLPSLSGPSPQVTRVEEVLSGTSSPQLPTSQNSQRNNILDLSGGLEEQERVLREMLVAIERQRTQARRAILGDLFNTITNNFDPVEQDKKEKHTEFLELIKQYLSGDDQALKNLATEWSVSMFTFLQNWIRAHEWSDPIEAFYMPYYDIEDRRYAKIAKAIEREKFLLTQTTLRDCKAVYEMLKSNNLDDRIIAKPVLEILKRDPVKYLRSLSSEVNRFTESHLSNLDVSELQALYYHLFHKIDYIKLTSDFGVPYTLLSRALHSMLTGVTVEVSRAQRGEAIEAFVINGNIPFIDTTSAEDAYNIFMQGDLFPLILEKPVLALFCKNPESVKYMKRGPDLTFLMGCFSSLTMRQFKALKYYLFGTSTAIGGWAQELERCLNDQLAERLGGGQLQVPVLDIFEFSIAWRAFSNDLRYPATIDACERALSNLVEQAELRQRTQRCENIYNLSKTIQESMNTLRAVLDQNTVVWRDTENRELDFLRATQNGLNQDYERLKTLVGPKLNRNTIALRQIGSKLQQLNDLLRLIN